MQSVGRGSSEALADPQVGDLFNVVLTAEGGNCVLIGWTTLLEQLGQLAEVVLVPAGYRGLEEDPYVRIGGVCKSVRRAGRHVHEGPRSTAEEALPGNGHPRVPVPHAAVDWLESKYIKAAFKDKEHLLSPRVHVRANIGTGRYDELEGRRAHVLTHCGL